MTGATVITREVLLDSRTLLWLVSTPEKIKPAAREVLTRKSCQIYVSAASAWEIAIKTRSGRLDGEQLLSAWPQIIRDMSAENLPVEAADAILAGGMAWEHRDPVDRNLVAQSTRRNFSLATRDKNIRAAALTQILKV